MSADPSTDRSAPPPPEQRPRCRCGHDRNHYMVSPKGHYTFWGWFWLTLVGASARPIRAEFRCRQCGEVIEVIDDPAELATLF